MAYTLEQRTELAKTIFRLIGERFKQIGMEFEHIVEDDREPIYCTQEECIDLTNGTFEVYYWSPCGRDPFATFNQGWLERCLCTCPERDMDGGAFPGHCDWCRPDENAKVVELERLLKAASEKAASNDGWTPVIHLLPRWNVAHEVAWDALVATGRVESDGPMARPK